jgi:RNA polymerase sigma-70 factor (ECF subfamily)
MRDAASACEPQARLTRWVEEHGPAVFGYLLHLVRNRHLAEDLLQEVFCRAWTARSRYAEQGKARAYLLRIADRLGRLHRRRAACDRTLTSTLPDELAGGESPLRQLEQEECRRQLDEALSMLSEAQRRTLLLRFYGDLEFSEIAAILGCPLNTALSHAHRGLRKLREVLSERPV